jgi:AraC-like DNA-binding protein
MNGPIQMIDWPAQAWPRVRIAGVFPLASRGFDHVYRSPTHALHLHDYEGTIRLASRTIPLEPGTLTWSPAGVASSYDLPRAGSHWCIHFDAADRDIRARSMLRVPLVSVVDRAECARRFARVIALNERARSSDDQRFALMASTALQELIGWASSAGDGRGTVAARSDAVQALVACIDRQLHRRMSVPALTRHVGFTQNYLARLFRAQTGMTIPRFIILRRTQLAQLLLRTTDLSVKQIGLRVGCPDPQHFNKLFRATAGESPSAYRGRHAG